VTTAPTPGDEQALDDDFDVLDAFDASVGVGQVRDPYPIIHQMQEECPVHVGPQWHRFGLDGSMASMLIGDSTLYTVMPFDAVQRVLKDNTTYSSTHLAKINGLLMGRTIIEMDEPDHHRYRALLQGAFSAKAMERWEHELVRPIVNKLIDGFVGNGRADLVRELFWPFPVHVIGALIGLPDEDQRLFHRKSVELLGVMTEFERAIAASQWLHDYFLGMIEQRRVTPADDLISILVEAELDGHKLNDEEIIAFLRLLLPAGAETTYRSSASLMFALLTHPDQLDAVRADRSLIPRAVEEGLRWESPVGGSTRNALADGVIEGCPVEEGAMVNVSLRSANRDPQRWSDPDAFDITREPQAHMAFGYGAHICLGIHLARMEIKAVTDVVLDRLPNVRLDPAADDVHVSGLDFRGPTELPVLFDA
jgi:cytochrome P450